MFANNKNGVALGVVGLVARLSFKITVTPFFLAVSSFFSRSFFFSYFSSPPPPPSYSSCFFVFFCVVFVVVFVILVVLYSGWLSMPSTEPRHGLDVDHARYADSDRNV